MTWFHYKIVKISSRLGFSRYLLLKGVITCPERDGMAWQATGVFREALQKVPQHVGALCGLAAAMLGRARECMVMGAFAWSASLAKVCRKANHL
jgi:hypothetical protein